MKYGNQEIIDKLKLKLDIKNNELDLPLEKLFSIGARKNPKRSFLFVSTLLGKHIAINPNIPKITGVMLTDLFLRKIEGYSPYDIDLLKKSLIEEKYINPSINHIKSVLKSNKLNLSKKTLILGFAETATGLGHAMFNGLNKDSEYIHTTREELSIESSFDFEEEHSHATGHLCYGLEKNYFDKFDRIVLVDDEITTGKTSLNLIKALNKKFPNKEYVIMSILDWRNDEEIKEYRDLERELNIKISELSFVQGIVNYSNEIVSFKEELPKEDNKGKNIEIENIELNINYAHVFLNKNSLQNQFYYGYTGRFGISNDDMICLERDIEIFKNTLISKRKFKQTLCMGWEEFIYIPSLIASNIGEGILYQSTTRSPIYSLQKENYPINNYIKFTDKSKVDKFIYNIIQNKYKEVFIFLEKDIDEDIKKYISLELSKLGVEHLVYIKLKF